MEMRNPPYYGWSMKLCACVQCSRHFRMCVMAWAALDDFEDFIWEKVEKYRWTYKRISAFLQEHNPGLRGFSERSVQWFGSSNNIHKTPRIDDQTLDEAVSRATDMVRIRIDIVAKPRDTPGVVQL